MLKVADINDLAALRGALEAFQQTSDRPTLIIVRSVIAWGAPNKQNTHAAHGAPLGEEEIRLAKAAYGWPEEQKFLVPEEVPAHFRANLGVRGERLRPGWEHCHAEYARQFPDEAQQLDLIQRQALPGGWDAAVEGLSRRRQGNGHAGEFGQGAQPGGQGIAVAGGRLGRPGPLDAHVHGGRG